MPRLAAKILSWTLYAILFLTCSSPVSAQFRPRLMNEPTGAEQFHIEVSAALWKPSADVLVSSEAFGIRGTAIDFKRDLGLTDQTLPEFKITLRPAGHHKLRMDVVPMSYTSSTTLTRDVVFNGQRYSLNLPITSTFDWTAWRFNYEFDFLAGSRYFVGVVIEAKYNDIRARLATSSPKIDEFTEARFPLPSLGGIARVYVVPSVSITGEVNGLKIPDSASSRYHGHWTDVDIYGTANFSRYIGAQLGFRSIDLGYTIDADSGSLTMKGIYFGIVARY
jgi:hypothetical protein